MFYQVRHSERNSYIIEVGSRKKDLSTVQKSRPHIPCGLWAGAQAVTLEPRVALSMSPNRNRRPDHYL